MKAASDPQPKAQQPLQLNLHRRGIIRKKRVQRQVMITIQKVRRLRTKLPEQAHGISIYLPRRKFITLRVEEPLVMGYAISHTQYPVELFLKFGSPCSLWPRKIES